MKCKRLISMGLATVMAMALGVPALAANTVITGTYQEIKIDVAIPTTGTAVINPYNMPVKAMSGTDEVGALTTAGKIATQPLIGISTCEVALDVGATVVGAPKGNMMLASEDISEETTNSAVIYLECKQDRTLYASDVTTNTTLKPISGIAGDSAVNAFNQWATSTYNFATDVTAETDNKDKVLVTETENTKQGLCTIFKGTEISGTMKPQQGSFLLARLGGDVVQNPSEAWSNRDSVAVTVSFTFTPAAPKVGLTIAKDTAAGKMKIGDNTNQGLVDGGANDTAPAAGQLTYKWEVVDSGSTGVTTATLRNADTNQVTLAKTANGSAVFDAGTIKLKCTVTDTLSGVQYVSEFEGAVDSASW